MDDKVPREIVQASTAIRHDYFKSRTVLHAKMKLLLALLLRLITKKIPLVFVFGPSGIGKSKLVEQIVRYLINLYMDLLNQDREWIPVAVNEIDEKSERYSWREFYHGGLRAIREPLIDEKILPRSGLNESYIPTGRATVDRWGNAYCDSYQMRRLLVALVDNANMLDVIPTRNKEAVTNPLIGLSKVVPHFLFGTYTLFNLRNLNGQIARRAKILHYSRYHWNHPKENAEFQIALNGFANHLPLDVRPDLIEDCEYLFRGCLGCIGLLQEWLLRALDEAMEENAEKLTIDHLKRTRLDNDSLRRLEKEAADGENLLIDIEDECIEASNRLLSTEEKWIEHFCVNVEQERTSAMQTKKSVSDSKSQEKPRGTRRPGNMNPRRIPIGKAIARLDAQQRGKALA